MSSDWLKRMQEKANKAKERMGSGGDLPFLKRLNLTGKHAVAKPGGNFILRLMPRWDIQKSVIKKGGKTVKNPDYEGGEIFLEAFEHWWGAEGGQRVRIWCPKTFGEGEACPVCDESAKLSKSVDDTDKKHGRGIQRREVYLFNAVMRDPKDPKKRMLDEQGTPDIRVLPASNTIFVAIAAIMTGDGEGEFARGDISDVKKGFDIKLTRPNQGGGDRWKVDCAQQPSPLYSDEEADAWRGVWPAQLVDLVEWVRSELQTAEEIYKAYHGQAGGAPASSPKPAPATSAPDEFGGGEAESPDSAGGSEEPPWGMEDL